MSSCRRLSVLVAVFKTVAQAVVVVVVSARLAVAVHCSDDLGQLAVGHFIIRFHATLELGLRVFLLGLHTLKLFCDQHLGVFLEGLAVLAED